MQTKQEAQLSPRDCAMLRVIEYFAKSLKVIRNDIVEFKNEDKSKYLIKVSALDLS